MRINRARLRREWKRSQDPAETERAESNGWPSPKTTGAGPRLMVRWLKEEGLWSRWTEGHSFGCGARDGTRRPPVFMATPPTR